MKYPKDGFIIASNRVFKEDGGRLIAEISFPTIREGVVDFNHTFVDDSLRGQGVAGTMIHLALDVLDKNGWKAVATCSFAVRWFQKHPEQAEKYLV